MEIKLVSIIIPCFNAERWVEEAINSCLEQTYPHLEIIVIDDGSTDSSLEIIKGFQGKVIWETGVNRGGNYARNRGFALSSGEYIQYLDSDDYLLPDKIAQHLYFLEHVQADIVYGDVRYQHHPLALASQGDIEGEIYQENATFSGIAGEQVDFLESLLAYGCLPPMAYLFKRRVIMNSQGWDESLPAGQDRDFLISLMINNPNLKVKYQPRVEVIYRRYGNITVSTSSKPRLVQSFCCVLAKAESSLQKSDQLSHRYIKALATSYYRMSQEYKEDISSSLYKYIIKKYLSLISKLWIKKLDSFRLTSPIASQCS